LRRFCAFAGLSGFGSPALVVVSPFGRGSNISGAGFEDNIVNTGH